MNALMGSAIRLFAARDGGGSSVQQQEEKNGEVALSGGSDSSSMILGGHDDGVESNMQEVSYNSSWTSSSSDQENEEGGGGGGDGDALSLQRLKDLTKVTPSSPSWKKQIRAFLRSLLAIDHTQIALVPAMRTALIMIGEMCMYGIDNNSSTAFRLGALFVGLTDQNGSISKRLWCMGLTLLSVLFFGALLPGLTWRSSAATLCTAFIVALLTGLSPALGSSSPALFLSMKLGMALFAINGGVNRSTNGYGGLGNCVFWTFCGSSISLAAALLPEIVGNRDAVRTDLFKCLHGLGVNLRQWRSKWGTGSHFNIQPVPTVTQSVSATKAMISDDATEDAIAKDWFLKIMECVDRIRVGSLCLSNDVREAMSCYSDASGEEIDAFFLAVGRACNRISFALQFPWLVRYVPFLKNRATGAVDSVNETAAAVSAIAGKTCESNDIHWLPSIAELIRSEVEKVAELVLDGKTWPAYSSLSSLPRRIIASFPTTLNFNEDPTWEIRGYALRLAIAFTLATIPEVIMKRSNAHWFPMTVAFIMGPTEAATYQKVVHRVIGTLLGLGFGTSMTPLFNYTAALILLLGLNTYAAVLFFVPNYAIFTFFITGWVYVTIVGAGASVGWTTLYRCGWTLAAGALVVIVTDTCPPKANAKEDVGDKLADMAKTVGSFAQAVLKQSHLRRLSLEENNENKELLAEAETAKEKVAEIRNSAIQARVAMLTCINEATLTPSEGYHIDPYSLAPCLAGDLVNAVVIPETLLLVADGSADGLLSDFDQETFSELDRLVKRLEFQEQATTSTISQPTAMITPTPSGRGPFSNAIARAHHRLDKAGIASL